MNMNLSFNKFLIFLITLIHLVLKSFVESIYFFNSATVYCLIKCKKFGIFWDVFFNLHMYMKCLATIFKKPRV